MPDMVGITRMADGTFLEVNAGFTAITGWEKNEIVGRTSVEIGLWTPEARAGAVAIVKEQGRLEKYAFLLGTKSGEKRNALMFLAPIKVRGEDCLFFIARDITELKQAHIDPGKRAGPAAQSAANHPCLGLDEGSSRGISFL